MQYRMNWRIESSKTRFKSWCEGGTEGDVQIAGLARDGMDCSINDNESDFPWFVEKSIWLSLVLIIITRSVRETCAGH